MECLGKGDSGSPETTGLGRCFLWLRARMAGSKEVDPWSHVDAPFSFTRLPGAGSQTRFVSKVQTPEELRVGRGTYIFTIEREHKQNQRELGVEPPIPKHDTSGTTMMDCRSSQTPHGPPLAVSRQSVMAVPWACLRLVVQNGMVLNPSLSRRTGEQLSVCHGMVL